LALEHPLQRSAQATARAPYFAENQHSRTAELVVLPPKKGAVVHSKRFLEHLRRQDWLAVGIEFVIVAAGVLLAMQVTNWNEQRLQQERGRAYYQRILADLRSNVNDMEQRAAYFEQVTAHAEAALAALRQPAPEPDEQFLVDLYQASQIQVGPITRASYDEAVASGALESVGDPSLRERLANYFSLADAEQRIYDQTTPYRDRIRRFLPDAVQVRMMTNCNDINSTDAQGLVSAALPIHCSLHLTRQQITEAVAAVRAAPELPLDLNRELSNLRLKVIQFRVVSNAARQIVRAMQAH
jgi:hypothetical protein